MLHAIYVKDPTVKPCEGIIRLAVVRDSRKMREVKQMLGFGFSDPICLPIVLIGLLLFLTGLD